MFTEIESLCLVVSSNFKTLIGFFYFFAEGFWDIVTWACMHVCVFLSLYVWTRALKVFFLKKLLKFAKSFSMLIFTGCHQHLHECDSEHRISY